jgi:hypothetical protein
MVRVAATAGLLVLAGATVAFARPGLGNSHDRSLRSTQIACGSERREVKQLLDDDAVNVAFGHGIDSTVKRMGQLKRPAETGPTRQKKERRVYRVWGIFDSIPPSETSPGVKLGYKTEDNDNDIHPAIRDSTGTTTVVEFPHHSCTAAQGGVVSADKIRGRRRGRHHLCIPGTGVTNDPRSQAKTA